jgi:hypothetical protein
LEANVRADLDTLLIAVYCAARSLFPVPPEPKRPRGRPRLITDNELICVMVAQMLLGIPSERTCPVIGWIRQRIESIVQTLKDPLCLEHHLAKTPAGLSARILARIVALCAAIHLNRQLGKPPRELVGYRH